MSWEVDSINLLRRTTHPKLDKDLYFKDLQKAFSFRSLSWAEKQAKNSILQNLKNKWEKIFHFTYLVVHGLAQIQVEFVSLQWPFLFDTK